MEDSYNLTVLMSALCGLVMVVGGIALLWRGAISLDAVAKTEALTVEWKKQFRLTTHAPALALFLIGLGFIIVPLWIAKPKDLPVIEIKGQKEEGISQPIRLLIETRPWSSLKPHKRKIREEIDLNNIVLVIKATAPLHEEEEIRRIPLSRLLEGELDLGEITLRRIVDEISVNKDLIDALPTDMEEAPVYQAGAFGK